MAGACAVLTVVVFLLALQNYRLKHAGPVGLDVPAAARLLAQGDDVAPFRVVVDDHGRVARAIYGTPSSAQLDGVREVVAAVGRRAGNNVLSAAD